MCDSWLTRALRGTEQALKGCHTSFGIKDGCAGGKNSRDLRRALLLAGCLLGGGLLRRDVRALYRDGGGLITLVEGKGCVDRGVSQVGPEARAQE
jgi:hypothetical protein